MIINDFLSRLGRKQSAHSDWMPKLSRHVTNDIVHYSNGYFGFTIRFDGIPFESISDAYLYTEFKTLAGLLGTVGKELGSRLSLWTTLQRRKWTFDRNYTSDNLFCQEFTKKYINKFQNGEFYNNHFYISGVVKYLDYDDGIRETESLIRDFVASLQSYDPLVLTAYQNANGVWFSEIYQFFASLVNYDNDPVPLTTVDACAILGDSDLHFGSDVLEIRTPKQTKYATCWDLKDFGESRVTVLKDVLTLPSEFTLTQSLSYVENTEIQSLISKQMNNFVSVNDQAHHQQDELLMAKGSVTSGELMFGHYHASLVIYADSVKKVESNSSIVTARFRNSGGFAFKKAMGSAAITYFSQVPNAPHRVRKMLKTTDNLATTFGLHNYSQGKSIGNPIGDGSAIMPLLTKSNTVYEFNWHYSNPKEDNVGDRLAGHTLILGSTGVGKTTLETSALTFSERFNPYLFALDLDVGLQIFIQATGGSYFKLSAGEPSGLNPFQLPDNNRNREFLNQLISICAGGVNSEEERQIKHAVDTIYSNDFEYRNFSVFLQGIPPESGTDSLRTRLSKWCRSEHGRFSWCLDNPINQFDMHSFKKIGFDLTDILKENYVPTEPILMYLFHLRGMMMDNVAQENGLLVTVIEECWYPLRFKSTSEHVLRMLKTDRRRGGWVVLATQSPKDVINCEIFPTVIEQTPTKIYLPNPEAEFEGSYERAGLTKKEFGELVKLGLRSHTFLVKQSNQSAFATLNLAGFTEELAVLSSDAINIAILDDLLKEQDYESANDWYPIFKERVMAAKKEKRLLKNHT